MSEISMPPLPKRSEPVPPAKPTASPKPTLQPKPTPPPAHASVSDSVDWKALQRAATEAARHAYAPYSRFQVGAAALVDDGRVVVGCNVENASYGLALCAECGLVSALHASGGGRLVAVSTVAGSGGTFNHITPCGRCRQLLLEHGGPELLVDGPDQPRLISELLPDAFTAADLPA